MVNQTIPRPRSHLQDHATADKAIIALMLMLAAKPKHATGIGPNRDDRPLFQELLTKWSEGQGGDKEAVMRARARVIKYGRQLQASVHWSHIIDPNMTRSMMIQATQDTIHKFKAEQELWQFIKQEESDYGNW